MMKKMMNFHSNLNIIKNILGKLCTMIAPLTKCGESFVRVNILNQEGDKSRLDIKLHKAYDEITAEDLQELTNLIIKKINQ